MHLYNTLSGSKESASIKVCFVYRWHFDNQNIQSLCKVRPLNEIYIKLINSGHEPVNDCLLKWSIKPYIFVWQLYVLRLSCIQISESQQYESKILTVLCHYLLLNSSYSKVRSKPYTSAALTDRTWNCCDHRSSLLGGHK